MKKYSVTQAFSWSPYLEENDSWIAPKNKEHDTIFDECIEVKSWSKHFDTRTVPCFGLLIKTTICKF